MHRVTHNTPLPDVGISPSSKNHIRVPSSSAIFLRLALNAIRREVFLAYKLTYRDWRTTIVPTMLLTLGAFYVKFLGSGAPSHPLSLNEWIVALQQTVLPTIGRIAIIFSFWVYCFNWTNQIWGVEEDKINKPDRPIPSGLVSIEGAKVRLAVSSVLYIVFAYLMAGWWPGALGAVMWLTLCAIYELGDWHRNPFLKSFWNAPGAWLQLAITQSLILEANAGDTAGLPAQPWSYAWGPAICIFVTSLAHIQDFRDIEGDSAVGRITLPILIGDAPARWVTVPALFANVKMMTFVGRACLGAAQTVPYEVAVVEWLSLACAIWTAFRLIAYRSPAEDQKTYMSFCAVYCIQMLYSGVCTGAASWGRV